MNTAVLGILLLWPVLGVETMQDASLEKHDNMGHSYSESGYSTPHSYSRLANDDLYREKLRFIFRPANLQGNVVDQLINGAMIPDIGWLLDHGIGQLKESIKTDPDLMLRVVDMLGGKREPLNGPDEFEGSNPWPAGDRGPERDQVGGYEGCRRDYSMIVDPISHSLLYGILGPVLDPLISAYCLLCGAPQQPPCHPTFCSDWEELPNKIPDTTSWGMQMFDALTKIPTDLYDGKLHWIGSYEQCHSIEARYNYTNTSYSGDDPTVTEERELKGKYSRVRIAMGINMENLSLPTEDFAIPIAFGLCVPDTCNNDDIEYYIMQDNVFFQLLGQLIEGLSVNVSFVYSGQQDYIDFGSDTDAQAALGILIGIIVLVIIATCYDSIFREGRIDRVLDEYHEKIPITPLTDQNHDNLAFVSDQKMDIPPSYTHVDPADHHHYANGDEKAKNADSVDRHISVTSDQPLVDEDSDFQTLDEQPPSWGDRFEVAFVGFSFYSNIRRIFNTKKKPDQMAAINGIRVLSFWWMLLGNTFLLGPVYQETVTTENLIPTLGDWPTQWHFQPIINYHYATDSFLVISGVLVAYWWLKRIEAQGNKLSIKAVVYYVCHKFWRFQPVHMLMVMIFVCFYRYLGNGPLFPAQLLDAEHCRTSWWQNLLLVHNIVNTHEQCFAWSWYLSCIFQLHVVTLVVLIPLVFKPIIGYVMLAVMYLSHIGATAYVADTVLEGNLLNWYYDYFITPWCRAGSYCIGVALGILLQKTRCKVDLHWIWVLLGWCCSLSLITLMAYITYDVMQEGGELWSDGARIAFDTLGRSAWALGVAWIIFACASGYGGFVATLLSWKFFLPLSRIEFSAIILHPMIVMSFVYWRYTLIYLSITNMLHFFYGHMFMVHILAVFMVAILFDYPFAMGLERAVVLRSKLHAIRAGNHPIDRVKRILARESAARGRSGRVESYVS